MSKKVKCPKCGCTETKLIDSDDLAGKFYGKWSLRCKKCDYLVHKSGKDFDNLMSRSELEAIKEKGERFTKAWNTEQLITKIKRGW